MKALIVQAGEEVASPSGCAFLFFWGLEIVKCIFKKNGFRLGPDLFSHNPEYLYCTFAQGKIIRFSIAPGDLQSKGLRTAFQMKKTSSRGLYAQMLE